MSTVTKILLSIIAVLTISLLSVIVYMQYNISAKQTSIEQSIVKQKDLIDNITRSQSEYATKKDVESFAKDNGVNLQAIKDDLDKLHAQIISVNAITVNSGGVVAGNIPSSGSGIPNPTPPTPNVVDCNGTQITCPNSDKYGYLAKQQLLTLNEPFGNTNVPLGEVGFSAWQQNPWNINILPRQYNVTSVVGIDENNRQYFYNKFSVVVNGKSYDVKIDKAETKQEVPEAKFSFFNPRLFIGIHGGVNINQTKGEATPNVTLGIMSYGKTKVSPDFSILNLGIGYSTGGVGQAAIIPVQYNIGKHIPFMNNTYIGPSVNIGFNGNVSIMAGISVGL